MGGSSSNGCSLVVVSASLASSRGRGGRTGVEEVGIGSLAKAERVPPLDVAVRLTWLAWLCVDSWWIRTPSIHSERDCVAFT